MDKERYSKYQRILYLTKQLLIGEQKTKDLFNSNSNKIAIPEFEDNNIIIEEIIILEAEIQCEIRKINLNKEKEAELMIKELINKIPTLIKDKR